MVSRQPPRGKDMFRLASPTDVRQHSRLDRILLTSTLALALIVLPMGMGEGPFLDWQTALAKNDGKGNAGGNGNGKGHGKGGRGAGHGLDDEDDLQRRGRGKGTQGVSGPHDLNEFLDGVRSGRAFGLERRDERIVEAKGRYREALGKPGQGVGHAEGGRTVAYGFSFEETTALIERGWKGPAAHAGFRNHGERTRTMVELAKQLGYGARVGALQANFGTPFENAIAGLQAELAAAEEAGDEAEAERLRGELATAIDQAKPGMGPDDGWATADLDVNDDQVVDRRDLEALAQGDDVNETEPEPDQEQVAEQSP
jgi:hypothetical protein